MFIQRKLTKNRNDNYDLRDLDKQDLKVIHHSLKELENGVNDNKDNQINIARTISNLIIKKVKK